MAFVIKPLQSFTSAAQSQDNRKLYLYQIDPLLIEEEDGFNLRYYETEKVIAHIEAFCESFMAGRYVPPMVVRALADGRVVVIEGHCRRRALRMAIARGAQIPLVSVIPFRGNDVERVELMLRSAQGLKLEALDVARGYLRLAEMGFSAAEIAASQSKSTARVEGMLSLAKAEPRVQALVRGNDVSADAAMEALRAHGHEAAEKLLTQLQEARQQGRWRLTKNNAGAARKTRPSRKLVEKVFTGIEAAMQLVPPELRKLSSSLQKMPEAERHALMVELSAEALVKMLEAGREIEKMKARRARRARQAEQAGATEIFASVDAARPHSDF